MNEFILLLDPISDPVMYVLVIALILAAIFACFGFKGIWRGDA